MLLPASLQTAIGEAMGSAITEVVPLTGGDINAVYRLTFANGLRRVLKCKDGGPELMFAAEAAGLRALAQAKAIRVPEVFLVGCDFLLIEHIPTGPRGSGFWISLAQQLAVLHQQTEEAFGFIEDNYCGLSPQPNRWTADGYRFFTEQRLLHQGRMAYDRGRLARQDMANLQALCAKLPDLIPQQPPALIHGDLWTGNLLCSESGEPVLIDPATHYGWAEAELAMTTLFSGFDETFYGAYVEVNPPEAGWQQRLPLYNLYHLLNHLNLFGESYRSLVTTTLRRFC